MVSVLVASSVIQHLLCPARPRILPAESWLLQGVIQAKKMTVVKSRSTVAGNRLTQGGLDHGKWNTNRPYACWKRNCGSPTGAATATPRCRESCSRPDAEGTPEHFVYHLVSLRSDGRTARVQVCT